MTHAMLTGENDDDDAAKLARREFMAGGPVHGVGFGVLTGALALAGLRTGELPRPVAITGLVSAASSLLSPLYFVWEPAGWLIPAGRFPGLLVSGVAGVRLARGARRSSGPQTSRSAEGAPDGCTARIHGLGNGPARRR